MLPAGVGGRSYGLEEAGGEHFDGGGGLTRTMSGWVRLRSAAPGERELRRWAGDGVACGRGHAAEGVSEVSDRYD